MYFQQNWKKLRRHSQEQTQKYIFIGVQNSTFNSNDQQNERIFKIQNPSLNRTALLTKLIFLPAQLQNSNDNCAKGVFFSTGNISKLKVQAELNIRCCSLDLTWLYLKFLYQHMLVFEHLGLHLWHVWHILCLHVVVQSEFQLKPAVRDCQNKATN